MNWIIYTIGAFIFWAGSNIVGKVVITKIINKPISYLIFINIIIGILAILTIPFVNFGIPSVFILSLCFLSGLVFTISVIPYLVAIKHDEISRVVPLWQFIPIFTLILASIFLGEKPSTNSYIAFILLVAGGFLISIKDVKNTFTIRPSFWLMFLSSFLFATEDVIAKYIFSNTSYWQGFIWIRVFSLFIVLLFLLFAHYRNDFFKFVKTIKAKSFLVVFGGEALDYLGMIFYYIAVSLGPISLVSAMHGLQPLFVLLFAIILSLWFPRILKEELRARTIVLKVFAMILMAIGLWFLYI